jgi:hypothetical protein
MNQLAIKIIVLIIKHRVPTLEGIIGYLLKLISAFPLRPYLFHSLNKLLVWIYAAFLFNSILNFGNWTRNIFYVNMFSKRNNLKNKLILSVHFGLNQRQLSPFLFFSLEYSKKNSSLWVQRKNFNIGHDKINRRTSFSVVCSRLRMVIIALYYSETRQLFTFFFKFVIS